MALDIWNQVEVEISTTPVVSVEGRGASELPAGPENLVYSTIAQLLDHVGIEKPSLSVRCYNEIPLKRGLGSSAAAIVGALVAGNQLISPLSGGRIEPLSQAQILDLAVEIEGHPDNVAAALLGGMVLVVQEEDQLLTSSVSLAKELHTVLYIPDMTIATEEARAVLPTTISRADAVYNMGRVALMVNALSSGRLEELAVATGDRIHQPYRRKLFPAMKVIFSAALAGGAMGVFLSGSGPTILALTSGREMTVAYEMAEAARQASIPGEVKITRPVDRGAHGLD